jgi:hypothetical protein
MTFNILQSSRRHTIFATLIVSLDIVRFLCSQCYVVIGILRAQIAELVNDG